VSRYLLYEGYVAHLAWTATFIPCATLFRNPETKQKVRGFLTSVLSTKAQETEMNTPSMERRFCPQSIRIYTKKKTPPWKSKVKVSPSACSEDSADIPPRIYCGRCLTFLRLNTPRIPNILVETPSIALQVFWKQCMVFRGKDVGCMANTTEWSFRSGITCKEDKGTSGVHFQASEISYPCHQWYERCRKEEEMHAWPSIVRFNRIWLVFRKINYSV